MSCRMVAAVVVGLLAQGCGVPDCHFLDCAPPVPIFVDPTIREPGTYDLELVADGTAYHCAVYVPPREHSDAGTGGAGAGATAGPSSPSIAGSECGPGHVVDPRVSFGSGLKAIWVNSHPERVSVTISKDREVIASGSFDLEYDTVYPNGPLCEPTCKNSEPVTLLVRSPAGGGDGTGTGGG